MVLAFRCKPRRAEQGPLSGFTSSLLPFVEENPDSSFDLTQSSARQLLQKIPHGWRILGTLSGFLPYSTSPRALTFRETRLLPDAI